MESDKKAKKRQRNEDSNSKPPYGICYAALWQLYTLFIKIDAKYWEVHNMLTSINNSLVCDLDWVPIIKKMCRKIAKSDEWETVNGTLSGTWNYVVWSKPPLPPSELWDGIKQIRLIYLKKWHDHWIHMLNENKWEDTPNPFYWIEQHLKHFQ